jgi:hypothetical protein
MGSGIPRLTGQALSVEKGTRTQEAIIKTIALSNTTSARENATKRYSPKRKLKKKSIAGLCAPRSFRTMSNH